jgi:predicted methyltransferase
LLLIAAGALGVWAQREDASRDLWQRPADVMAALGIAEGSRVADVGCGEGYFVMHLARRVGASGIVYAVDLDVDSLKKLQSKMESAGITNVRVIVGKQDDPLLPSGELDAVLVVNAYHEMGSYDAMLRAIHISLRPGGRLGIIDAAGNEKDSRRELMRRHEMSETLVREDAERNGFAFASREQGFKRPERNRENWFFLIFMKP